MLLPFSWPRRSPLIGLAALLAVHAGLAATLVSAARRVQAGLMSSLAARFEPPDLDANAPPTGIIVLGGSFERTREGVRLSRQYPNALLVVSGASQPDYDYARRCAADPQRVVIEPDAKSTFDNARFTRRLLQPRSGERWLLVTSAGHMPRAVATFRGVDFAVVPWPVHDEPGDASAAAQQATHEVLGLIGYRLMGRTRELWPALDRERAGLRADATRDGSTAGSVASKPARLAAT